MFTCAIIIYCGASNEKFKEKKLQVNGIKPNKILSVMRYKLLYLLLRYTHGGL